MRRVLGFLCCGFLCCFSVLAADLTQLRRLHDQNRIFQLEEALRQPRNDSGTMFYRAVTEARFGHETSAIEMFRTALAASPAPEIRRKANEEMAAALVRTGKYGEAAQAWAEALRVTPANDPDREDTANSQALYQALSDVAPQSIRIEGEPPIQATHNPLGSWDVPVGVNGRRGLWIFDTGANLSTVSESEAVRLGLATRDSATYVKGSTGTKNSLRLAVARELSFGGARLSNVVFLVLSDKALHVGPLKYQIRGILGLPVIRALGMVEVTAKGGVRIESRENAAPGAPNLFFDELDPIVAVRHQGHPLQMFLDTGANRTGVNPSFRDALDNDEIASLKKKQEKTGGAGGIVTREAEALPTLSLELPGRTVDLKNVTLLLKQPARKAGLRDGVVGMDALAGGFSLDFRAMQLRLE